MQPPPPPVLLRPFCLLPAWLGRGDFKHFSGGAAVFGHFSGKSSEGPSKASLNRPVETLQLHYLMT